MLLKTQQDLSVLYNVATFGRGFLENFENYRMKTFKCVVQRSDRNRTPRCCALNNSQIKKRRGTSVVKV
jgi:hypothetical protein